MSNKKKVSRFNSKQNIEGSLEVGLLFYKLPNEEHLAMRYKWDDNVGFHTPEALSKQHVMDACVHMKESDATTEYIHERVVLQGQNYFAFWVPQKRRKIWIHDVKRKTYTHPPLLILVKNYSMHIYELAVNRRPTLNSYIHHPRYHGIDVHGFRVGQCNVRIPDTMTPDPEAWEESFFLSKFNAEPYKDRQKRCGKLEDLL